MKSVHPLNLLPSDWKACEACSLYIYKKDNHIHQKHCTRKGSEQICQIPHGYIYNGTLYALVSISKEKVRIPASVQPLVFMHPSTMKLLHFGIDDSVVLIGKDSSPAIFNIWPDQALHPSNIGFPEKQTIKPKRGDQVSVHRYGDMCIPASVASELHFAVNRPEDYMHLNHFKNFILQELRGIFIWCGMKMMLNYRGKNCEIEITNVQSPSERNILSESSNVNQMCSQLSDLSLQNEISCKRVEVCFPNIKHPLARELNHAMKCSTPISAKVTSLKINEISCLNLSSETEDSENPQKYFVVTPKTAMILQDISESVQKKVLFKDIGGLGRQIEEIRNLLHPFFNSNFVLGDKNLPKGIILVGPPGTGKSLVVKAIVNELQVPAIFLNRNDVFNRQSGGAISNLRKIFNHASLRAPCLLILDEIHTLYKKNGADTLTNEERSVTDELPKLIESLPSSGRRRVIIIATTNSTECLDSTLIRHGRFEKEIEFFIPDVNDRREIFEKLLSNRNHNLLEDEIIDLLDSSHGFTGADLQKVCQEATIQSRLRCKNEIMDQGDVKEVNSSVSLTFTDFMNGLSKVKPNIMKEYAIEVPKVHWSDIGGMKEVKEEIMDMTDMPLKHPEAFKAHGITPSRGVLMYGPPGCSKTMIAKAVAIESQLNFISVKGPELFNKFVGESEGAIRKLFRKAEASFPCIIFFDEIDSLAAERGNSSSGSNVGERVLTQLLTEIDGINVKKGICTIAATNRPDLIDPAFLRPGRFDSVVYVPLPDQLTRQEIFQIKLKKVPLSSDVDVQYLVKQTEGYTGAEVVTVCNEAAMMAAFEDIACAMTSVIAMSHFEEALKHIKPRTPKELLKFYEKFKSQYCHVQIVQ